MDGGAPKPKLGAAPPESEDAPPPNLKVKGADLLASVPSVFGAPPRLNKEGFEESLFVASEDLKENFGGSEEPFDG